MIDLLNGEPNIIFAYLFGGFAKGRVTRLSDVDLALYLKKAKGLDYLALFRDISKTLGTDEMDLIILNTAPLSLTGRILQNRKVLLDKGRVKLGWPKADSV